jgi:catechol 2,3-dioxygenase-like lactoylglutathione lyase family enzyme
MRVTGINVNLPVADIAAARDFYTDYLGLSVEEFNLGWVARYRAPSGEASVQLVTRDATAPHDSVIRFMSAPRLTRRTRRRSGGGTRSFTRSRKKRGGCGGSSCALRMAM